MKLVNLSLVIQLQNTDAKFLSEHSREWSEIQHVPTNIEDSIWHSYEEPKPEMGRLGRTQKL